MAKAGSRELSRFAASFNKPFMDVGIGVVKGLEAALNLASGGRTGYNVTDYLEKGRESVAPENLIEESHPVTKFLGSLLGGLGTYMINPAIGTESALVPEIPALANQITPMANLMRGFTKNLINFSTVDVARTVGEGGGPEEAKNALLKSIPTAAIFTVAQAIPWREWIDHPWLVKTMEGIATGTAFTAMPVMEGETDPTALATNFITGWALHMATSGLPSRNEMQGYKYLKYQKALNEAFDQFKIDWDRTYLANLNDAQRQKVQEIIDKVENNTIIVFF